MGLLIRKIAVLIFRLLHDKACYSISDDCDLTSGHRSHKQRPKYLSSTQET